MSSLVLCAGVLLCVAGFVVALLLVLALASVGERWAQAEAELVARR